MSEEQAGNIHASDDISMKASLATLKLLPTPSVSNQEHAHLAGCKRLSTHIAPNIT